MTAPGRCPRWPPELCITLLSRPIRPPPNAPTQYNIGGTLEYVDPQSGNEVTTPLFPSTITVYPQANLVLNYFLQQDVIGEDPSMPNENIPSEPAVLGVLVTNIGGGTANNLSITTAQPQIVQNDKGLLDNFTIIGSQVDGQEQRSDSLTVNFGNLGSGDTGDADFLILSPSRVSSTTSPRRSAIPTPWAAPRRA